MILRSYVRMDRRSMIEHRRAPCRIDPLQAIRDQQRSVKRYIEHRPVRCWRIGCILFSVHTRVAQNRSSFMFSLEIGQFETCRYIFSHADANKYLMNGRSYRSPHNSIEKIIIYPHTKVHHRILNAFWK
jgi:hypothetical protein